MKIDVSEMKYAAVVRGCASHYFSADFSFKRYGTDAETPVVLQAEVLRS